MAIYIKGNAVPNATSYTLYYESGGIYYSVVTQESSTGINFNLTDLCNQNKLARRSYNFYVKANALDYESSEYSNLIVCDLSAGESEITYTFSINPTPANATVILSAFGYSTVSGTGSKSITVANGTEVSWSVSADGYTTRTGEWIISGANKTENIVLTASGGGEIPEGEWLSVLLTGDADAHNKFMNGTLTGAGSLGKGYDVIYTTTNIQSLLEGKKIYKFASNGLGDNIVTLYSNPYVGNTPTNTPEGRTVVGTVTSTSAQAAGTITEYSVSNPSAIKNGETLSVSWSNKASGIKTVEGYTTPVYYLTNGVFKSALTPFCSFDFYVGE